MSAADDAGHPIDTSSATACLLAKKAAMAPANKVKRREGLIIRPKGALDAGLSWGWANVLCLTWWTS